MDLNGDLADIFDHIPGWLKPYNWYQLGGLVGESFPRISPKTLRVLGIFLVPGVEMNVFECLGTSRTSTSALGAFVTGGPE